MNGIKSEVKASIRPAETRDIESVSLLYEKIHEEEEAGRLCVGWQRDVYPVRRTAEAALLRGDLFVMERDGQLLAAAIINHLQPDGYELGPWQHPASSDRVMVLHTLAVDPAFAGQGCGKKFVAFYEAFSMAHGCPFLRMDTNADNLAARALYRKLGYNEVAIVPTVFNGIAGVSLVLLEKKLPTEDYA